jgi:hypothetical protein
MSLHKNVAAAFAECNAWRKLDAMPKGHDAAIARIERHVRSIEMICDEFGYDPTQWLAEQPEPSDSANEQQ